MRGDRRHRRHALRPVG